MSKPNIVLVITDHTNALALRPDSGCATPNLDRLSEEGLRFDRCYTTNAICSPARASLMTGQYPSTHGVLDCTQTQRSEWVDVHDNPVFWSNRLADAGYKMGYFGKWHVEQSKELDRFGWQEFDHRCGYYRVQVMDDRPGLKVGLKGYKDRVVAGVGAEPDGPVGHPAFNKGIDFIRTNAEAGPFCCVISTLEPHDPYIPPQRFFDAYTVENAPLRMSLRAEDHSKPPVCRRMAKIGEGLTDDDWRLVTTAYFASISFLDHELGRVLQTLRDAGIYEDTIVVFTADHGDMIGGHGLLAKGITPYEEVYNIPLVVRVPGQAIRGCDGDHRVSLLDLAPSLCQWAGAEPLPDAHGRSIDPVLTGKSDSANWQDAYAEFFGQRFVYTQRLVWHGDWKYIFSPGGVDELYNLAEDPDEIVNRADDPQCREVLEDMCARMWAKMASIGDDSLTNTHYVTLQMAPVGPLARPDQAKT